MLKRYIQKKKRIKFCCCLLLAICSHIHHHPGQYELQELMPSGSVIMKKEKWKQMVPRHLPLQELAYYYPEE